MSTIAKSRKCSGKPDVHVNRPFAPAILARARQIVEHYQVVMWLENGEWYGRGLELPLTMDDGKTPDRCMARVRKALVTTVAAMLEDGMPVPPPAAENLRCEQVNVRVSLEEKLLLESAARWEGCEGVSDFVRSRALAAARRD
jgi:predicted RNase H-like HicB family nuclease